MNGAMYADLFRDYAAPAVKDLYPEGEAIWQNNPVSIHRCAAALDHEVQCPKFSDVWPIENVWELSRRE